MESRKVLLVEDDPNIAELIDIHLKDLGFELEHETDGDAGIKKALDESYSLIILDIMLPGKDGIEICKELRKYNKEVPVLMLTAKSEEIDKVIGFNTGADDYLTKPFSIAELIARIKALFRRIEIDKHGKPDAQDKKILQYGKLLIDLESRRVTIDGAKVDLTVKEYELLVLFAGKPGRSFSRMELLNLIWGYQFSGYEHTVNSHINRLRNKIEKDPANPQYIKTVWGVGYRFAEPEELEND